jgi:alpha-beta hydrolase superfamily lysophospholipase
MKRSTFTFKDQDGIEIFVYKWVPDSDSPKAAVQIAHGLAEHAARYEKIAEALTSAGYICYADDHRGHGKTAGDIEKTGYLGPGGWESTVKEIKMLSDIIKKENPNILLFFIGHSWGSLMGQDYIQQWGNNIKGVIFSGTSGYMDPNLLKMGEMITKKELKKFGPMKRNEKLFKLTFASFNKPFEPAETEFQWLSRDQDEVNKYANDPFCGFICTTSLFDEFIYGLIKIWKEENERKIPIDLPIYIISGSDDPSNDMTKNLFKLIERYQKYGIKDLTYKIYQNARHEIFNEINQNEVFKDVIDWLDLRL